MKTRKHKNLKLYTDGGARGNPGLSAVGCIILGDDGKWLDHNAKYIGYRTNNQAEYRALIRGLKRCRKYTNVKVTCFSDSELMINQLNGKYRIKDPILKDLARRVRKIAVDFDEVTFVHVRRTNDCIQIADQLLNDVLDKCGWS